jgi:Na+/melibiose symporter-like transporter
MPISYLINFFFENTLGYSVLKSGLMMGIPSLTALLVTPFMPLLAKKLSSRAISFLSIMVAVTGNLLLAFMNSANYMIIICIAFVLMGLGIRLTTILYQTAYEEISKDKNGIASGIQNSLRQLTACIAIALVSTLSTHYTLIAKDTVNADLIREVNDSAILMENVKASVITAVNSSSSSVSFSDSKDMVHTLLTDREKKVLPALPADQQTALKEQFAAQETELDQILDHTKILKENESFKVYNKCFLFTGIVAMAGLFAVPFNRKKQYLPNAEPIF